MMPGERSGERYYHEVSRERSTERHHEMSWER